MFEYILVYGREKVPLKPTMFQTPEVLRSQLIVGLENLSPKEGSHYASKVNKVAVA